MFSARGIIKLFVEAFIILILIVIIKKVFAKLPLPAAVNNFVQEG